MAFKYYSTTTVPLPPYEFKGAKSGDYVTGQVVALDTTGLVAPISAAVDTAPEYISMYTGKVAADGDLVPTSRAVPYAEYETELTAGVGSLVVGSALEVSASGLGVDGAALGAFIVTSFDGKNAGDAVRGHFSFIGAQGPTGPTGA
jgi:hypothetical protein